MKIRASVVDIRGDDPSSSDRLLVDSNVWIGLTDANPSPSRRSQWRPYERYIRETKDASGRLVVSPFTFPEICKYFEHEELGRHNARNSTAPPMQLKAFREDTASRSVVVAAIDTSWRQVRALATLVLTPVTQACVDGAMKGLGGGDLVDGVDAMLVADLHRDGLTGIITDDRDFGSIDGILVFTANEKLLRSAAEAGRTVRRP